MPPDKKPKPKPDQPITEHQIEMWALAKLKPYEKNSRGHSKEQVAQIQESIKRFGFTNPILVGGDGEIIAGHGRLMAAQRMGLPRVPVIVLGHLDEAAKMAYRIADNQIPLNASWYEGILAQELLKLRDEHNYDLSALGFSDDELKKYLAWAEADAAGLNPDPNHGALAEKFGISPFSVFNAREGWWQARKQAWVLMGIQSELGRDKGKSYGTEGNISDDTGTSIFDPVLCEIAYRWFCGKEGTVLDPFAGGSVRGIVASKLGRRYTGIDLRIDQVKANRAQANEICAADLPEWIQGDSRDTNSLLPAGAEFDFVFSCPPYGSLEKYSDDPADLSNMGHEDFLLNYQAIIALACKRLKVNRYAVFVVGDFRDKKGNYRNFVSDTIHAFLECEGMSLYGEGILVTAVGSLAMRVGKQFTASRKLGKTHQNVLIFLKGDAKLATAAAGEVEFGDIGATDGTFNHPG